MKYALILFRSVLKVVTGISDCKAQKTVVGVLFDIIDDAVKSFK